MPGPLRHASYLAERLSAQYRLIVDALLEAQSHSLTGVARTELPNLLRHRASELVDADLARTLVDESGFDLDTRMQQLRAWGVIEGLAGPCCGRGRLPAQP